MARDSDMLVDRERERDALRTLAERPPRLALLYGRRRLGKTFLLDRTWPDRRVFYFLAADSTGGLNRADLIRDLAAFSGRALAPEDYPTWRTVFRLLADLAREEPLIVVLDEFQYLLGDDDDAASQLVAVWDRELRGADLTVVVCGSEVSTMTRLRQADQPLYGRFDWSHRLRPFDYFDAGRMLPGRNRREAALAYGVFGGTPLYLGAIDNGELLPAAVTRLLLEPGGLVRVQLENLVEQERGIRKPAEYRAVLSAVARGRTERNEIANASGLQDRPETVRHILDRLQDLDFVVSERNFGAPANAPLRHRIADNAVRFWHRFVEPSRSQLELGGATEVWSSRIEPRLGTYMGKVFEGICREAYVRRHAVWGAKSVTEWSRWEGHDRNRRPIEIDVVARLADGGMLTGEVKWSSTPIGPSVHTGLLRDLAGLAASGQPWAHQALPEEAAARYIYFSAGGFTPAFRALASEDERIALVDLADLYGERDDGS